MFCRNGHGTARLSPARGITAVSIAEYVMTALFRDAKRFESLVCHSRQQWLALSDDRKWLKGTFGSVKGQTLGVIGYGAIGQATAERARAVG